MTDQTMAERVARAIFAQWRVHMDEHGDRGSGARSYDALTEREKDFSLKGARAAIEAMREVTPNMVLAGKGELLYEGGAEVKRGFIAMINAALSEGVSK